MLQVVHSVQPMARGDIAARAVHHVPSVPAVDRVSALATTKTLRAREIAFHEADDAEHMFEVVSGVLKLYKLLPDGRRQITGFAYPGHWVGIGFCRSYAYTAEAVTEATLARYPRARLEGLCDEVPRLARKVLSFTASELAAAQDQMLLLGRKSAAEKVASFLLRLSRWAEERGEDPEDLSLPMSRSDIADHLGLTIETASRILTQFCRARIIETRGRNRVRLLDPDQLLDLAEGEAPALVA